MARQSFIWTALPNGYSEDGSALRLSLMLSPRLDPQADARELKSFFPDWLDWPATLSQATFTVRLGASSISVPASQTTGLPRVGDGFGGTDPAVWASLFKSDLPVSPFAFTDLSDRTIVSYDYLGTVAAAEKLYADLAAGADDELPSISQWIEQPGWRDLLAIVRELDRDTFDQESGLSDPRRLFDILARTESGAGLDHELARFRLFHAPPAKPKPRSAARTDDPRISAKWLEYENAPMPTPAEVAKMLDFHRFVASMGSHPVLLRRLGLVVDVLLPPASLVQSADAPLGVEAAFPAGLLKIARMKDAQPQTRTLLDAARFQAVSRAAPPWTVTRGLLDLDPVRFGLAQLDADSAWLKLMNFARTLDRSLDSEARRDSVSRQENRAGAPSLRNAGLMLVHSGRGTALSARMASNKLGNTALETQFAGGAAAVTLMAEDLVRGYRVDIRDSLTGRWRSLFRRDARYEMGGGSIVVTSGDEEATLQMAATQPSGDTGGPAALYLHEAMMTWSGWSLAAPLPGRAVLPDDSVDSSSPTTEQQLPPGIDFVSRFKPTAGSLPRLRFGRTYALRARAVDLAGNSLSPSEADFGWEASAPPSREFLRYEPVESPALALLSQAGAISAPGPGESMNRMAIRSFNDTPDLNSLPTPLTAVRAVAPPRVSVRDAELHGMLDVGTGVADFLFDMLAHQKDIDPRDPAAAIREEKLALQSPFEPAPGETYLAVHELGRALTYLPDPMANEVSVRFFGHPDIAESEIIVIPLYPEARWPEAAPFTLRMVDDPGVKPYFMAETRQLVVPVPKGLRVRARLSMRLAEADLQKMGVFRLLAPAAQAAQRGRARDGQHWMLTPWRVVELVHAVQRPLIAPDVAFVSIADRKDGATGARPVMQLACSMATTDRLDLHAEWHEPIDDPSLAESELGPADRKRRDLAFHVKVTEPADYAQRLLGDAGGGYPDHAISGPDTIGINSVGGGSGHAVLQPKVHEFHDTRYRRIEYWFDATTRYREYLPAELLTRIVAGEPLRVDDHIKRSGARKVCWIPSSAPPPAPRVLYLVPTFGWVREAQDDGGVLLSRKGGGLRVYLDRPWNCSGYGEMLAVVLPPAGFAGDPEKQPRGHVYKDYVTQWGNDPAWDSGFVPGLAPGRSAFLRARTAPDPTGRWLPRGAPAEEADQQPGAFCVTGLRVPRETGLSAPVEIAPHDVFFDEDRRLWYCDIEVEPGAAYFPFIRLALARYQPISSTDAYLSEVMLADFMALSAHRWVSITRGEEERAIHLVVSGVRAAESSAHREGEFAPSLSLTPLEGPIESIAPGNFAKSTTAEVWLEELDERYGEDFGWQKVAAARTGGDPVAEVSPAGEGLASELHSAALAVEAASPPAYIAAGLVDELVTPWETLWNGDIHLPAPSGRRRRLVVAEYEEYAVDDRHPYDKTPERAGRRLVFVEHLEIDDR